MIKLSNFNLDILTNTKYRDHERPITFTDSISFFDTCTILNAFTGRTHFLPVIASSSTNLYLLDGE